jgi:hypothetical protein
MCLHPDRSDPDPGELRYIGLHLLQVAKSAPYTLTPIPER